MILARLLTLWTIRISAALYVTATALWIVKRDAPARRAWTAACLLYLGHAIAAFHFYHSWSHAHAYRETARQTAEVFGILWGGGIYFNYVFSALWLADVCWWWRGLAAYRSRPRWIAATVESFIAFMFFNATVVFGRGWVRWFGVAATVGLSALAYISHTPVIFRDKTGETPS